jgi:2-haloacid dehalogenase
MTTTHLKNIKACVFDAYGTLFDVDAAARGEKDQLGENWQAISNVWRQKQLQYTWLRSLQGNYISFWNVTEDALDFALDTVGIEDSALKQRLMDLYLQLSTYNEVPDVLRKLKNAGLKCAILSNGSPEMLQAAVENAGIADLLDGVHSVQDVGIFKPHPSVYQLSVDLLDVAPSEISFQSSNAWDAYSAKDFGFNVIWCNRFGQAPERLSATPDAQITNLTEMLPLLDL